MSLIVKIEGPQGSRKTTLLSYIMRLLENAGYKTISKNEELHQIEIELKGSPK